MNEQTRNALKVRLDELESLSAKAWEDYQAAEQALNAAAEELAVPADPLEGLRLAKKAKQAEWHRLYTAADGLRAVLALEAE